jgi:hypothetical protein
MSIESSTAAPPAPALPPLRSMHTTNFGPLLGELGLSLLVTTYQGGRVSGNTPGEQPLVESLSDRRMRAFPGPETARVPFGR